MLATTPPFHALLFARGHADALVRAFIAPPSPAVAANAAAVLSALADDPELARPGP